MLSNNKMKSYGVAALLVVTL